MVSYNIQHTTIQRVQPFHPVLRFTLTSIFANIYYEGQGCFYDFTHRGALNTV